MDLETRGQDSSDSEKLFNNCNWGMVGRISPGAERRDDPLVEWIQFGTGARSVNVLSQGRCAGEV